MSAAVQAASKVKKDTRDDGYVGRWTCRLQRSSRRASKAWRSCSTHGANDPGGIAAIQPKIR